MADFDLIVIGSGPAGYIGAIHAAQRGLKTACVEKYPQLGGTCLNVGCIPSKALLHASELLFAINDEGKEWGLDINDININFSKMMEKKEQIIKKLTGGIEYLLKKNKVEKIFGNASFQDANTLVIEGKVYTAKNILIATGSKPISLPFLEIDEKKIVSSTGILSLKEIPKKLVVVGGGVIGLELGSVYKRLGSEVLVIEYLDRIIAEYDDDISSVFQRILEKQGIKFELGAKVIGAKEQSGEILLTVDQKGITKEYNSDCVLVSIGRKPYFDGLNLENAGINLTNKGFIKVDRTFKTSNPYIYAVGDVIGGQMLAHKGSHEAVVAVDGILGGDSLMKYGAVPGVIYTNPEVATVGASEKDLKERGVKYKLVKFPLSANSRYVATGGSDPCFIKYLYCESSKKLFGASMIAPHAGELIGEPTLAISAEITVDKLAHTIHAHPTLLESLHEASLGCIGKFYHM